jgi:translation elongation factor P/translation initiation factor 5A
VSLRPCRGCGIGSDEELTTETKQFQIISVDGNNLVVRGPEGTREITVPQDFTFTVNGKPMSVSELKPGMKGTATITTTTTVHPVYVTEVRNGTVVQATGGSILVKDSRGVQEFYAG